MSGDVAPLLRQATDRVGSEAGPIPLNTQDIRESYIPCQCEQSGQHLLWLWDALAEVDRLRGDSS